jgi:hypothetical protein
MSPLRRLSRRLRLEIVRRVAAISVAANTVVNAAGIGPAWAVPTVAILAGLAYAAIHLVSGMRRIGGLPRSKIPARPRIQAVEAQEARHRAVGGALLGSALAGYGICWVQLAAILSPEVSTRTRLLTELSMGIQLVAVVVSFMASRHLLAQRRQRRAAAGIGALMTVIAAAALPFRTNPVVVAAGIGIVASVLAAFLVRTFAVQAYRGRWPPCRCPSSCSTPSTAPTSGHARTASWTRTRPRRRRTPWVSTWRAPRQRWRSWAPRFW